jgi:histidyl-tRNA synthetase
VKVNDRRILKGVARYAGVPEGREAEVFRALDKLDKIGTEGVRAELETLGFGGSVVDRLFAATAAAGSPEATLKALETTLIDDAEARVGVDALREVLEGAVALGAAQKRLVVDPTLTRGLDYYTGPVYEVVLDVEEKFGSLGGGGRYDDLMSLFSDKKTPATGVSIGLTRVLSALLKFDLLKPRPSPTEAMVLRLPDAPVGELLRLVSDLRARGVATELYYEPDRLKKQFAYAEKKGVRFALVAGATELSEGIVQVKTLATGEQVPTPRADVAAYVEARRKA